MANLDKIVDLDSDDDDSSKVVTKEKSSENLDNINPDLEGLIWDEDDTEPNDAKVISDIHLTKKDKALLEKYKDLDIADEQEEKEMDQMRTDRRKLSERLESDPAFKKIYIAAENKKRKQYNDEEIDNIISSLQNDSTILPNVPDMQNVHDAQNRSSVHDAQNRDSAHLSNLDDLEMGDTDLDNELEDLEDVEDLPFLQKSSPSVIKPGILIQKVKNLTININIS